MEADKNQRLPEGKRVRKKVIWVKEVNYMATKGS